ncbi:MAG: transglutaminase [Comamonadaceae bacterium CG_4_9_14_0_8_um_filter_57_21]|nr:MAG: transglutaminase [Comamonadaceae bacterium CG_4_9_14_0_8_um_filter_57_21]
MNLSLNLPTPLEYFAALVHADADFPLLEAAISLAQDEYPDLSVQQVLGDVDQLLARLMRRLPPDAGPLQKLRALNQFVYRDLSFAGNFNNFADPDNSFVHVVLRTRLAIPISMAVIWLELAQGIGLKARGIAFPGHFLVKVNLSEGQVVIDPLTGQSLSREDLAERLEPYRQLSGLVDEQEVPLGLYLQAATPRDTIARMLLNLKEIHAAQEDWQRLIAVLDRLIVLLPEAWAEYRDRGLAHAEAGHSGHALEDLETYLANTMHASAQGQFPDRAAIAQRVTELRRTTN